MSDNLAKALAWSALLHLLVIAVLWYTQQPVPMPTQHKAIEAFVYQPIISKVKPPTINPAEVAPAQPQAAELKPAEKPIATVAAKAKPQVKPEKPISAPHPTNKAFEKTTDKPLHHSQTTDATHVTNPTQGSDTALSLAERSLAIATRRNHDISSAALAASQQRPELRDRPATTSKVQVTPEHAAANVLMVLNDGSFIEKVGDHCYQAKPGADLRSDIFSMKPVPCGEDKNAALYDRIMSKVGQDR